MFKELSNLDRKEVVIDDTQNESAQKLHGCNFFVGQKCWLMVCGKAKREGKGYILECSNGEKLSGGFPVAYAHDNNGNKYMVALYIPGFAGLFLQD